MDESSHGELRCFLCTADIAAIHTHMHSVVAATHLNWNIVQTTAGVFMSNNCLLLIMVQINVTYLKHFFPFSFLCDFSEGKYTKVLLY